MNINFDSENIYGDSVKYIKTKVKTYGDKINTIFHNNKMPKQNVSYKCLPVIMLDSDIRTNKKYYPQTLVKECKHDVRNKKAEKLITYDSGISSSHESDSEPDSEPDNESEKPSKKSDNEPDNESD